MNKKRIRKKIKKLMIKHAGLKAKLELLDKMNHELEATTYSRIDEMVKLAQRIGKIEEKLRQKNLEIEGKMK